MRPNFAQDAPPTEISVGGFSYKCETDYRVWLEVLRLLGDMQPDDASEDGIKRTMQQIEDIQLLVFGGVLKDENPAEVLKAVSDFSKGYPTAPMQSQAASEATFSFEYDLNEIIIAIRNQSGIDLSYRRKEPFHWWEFLLEFRTLSGDHYILRLMENRGYKGKDPECLKRKRACALPVRYTAAELAEYEAFSALFDTDDKNTEDEDEN